MQTTVWRGQWARRALGAAAAATVLGAGLVTVVRAEPAGATSAATGSTLRLVGHPTGGGAVDAAPKGPSVGDEFFASGYLTEGSARHRGTFTLSTQLVAGDADAGFEQSETVAYLGPDTLVMSGGHGTVDRFTLPVSGGTGRYAGARGSAAFSPGPQGVELVTVHLLP